jgi:hypothetical protein
LTIVTTAAASEGGGRRFCWYASPEAQRRASAGLAGDRRGALAIGAGARDEEELDEEEAAACASTGGPGRGDGYLLSKRHPLLSSAVGHRQQQHAFGARVTPPVRPSVCPCVVCQHTHAVLASDHGVWQRSCLR